MSIAELVENELAIMRAQKVELFTDQCDIVLCMQCHMNQLVNCYITTNQNHATKLLVKLVAHIKGHFDSIKQPVQPSPRSGIKSFGHGLLLLGKAIDSANAAITRGASGDVQSHMMDVLAIAYGTVGDAS